MPNINEILLQAYQYTKNHKFLWFFGFFLMSGGLLNLGKWFDIEPKHVRESILSTLEASSQGRQEYLIGVILGIVCLILAILLIGAISRSSLVYSALSLQRKEEITFRSVLKKSQPFFWKVFVVNLFVNVLTLMISVWLVIPVYYFFSNQILFDGLIIAILAGAIFLPIYIILSLVNVFSTCFVVVYKMKPMDAIKASFDLLFKNWIECLSLLVILFVVYLTLFFLTASMAGLLGSLAYVLSVLLKSLSSALFQIFGVILLVSLTATLLVANAILNVYVNIAWTLFFLNIVKAKKLPEETQAAVEPAI